MPAPTRNRAGRSRMVEVDVLGLHIVLQPTRTEFAADTGLFEPAPRGLHRRAIAINKPNTSERPRLYTKT